MAQTTIGKLLHTLTAIYNLAMLLEAQGKPSEAEPLFQEAQTVMQLTGYRISLA